MNIAAKWIGLTVLFACASAWGSEGTAPSLPACYSGENNNNWANEFMPVGWTRIGENKIYKQSYDNDGFATGLTESGKYIQIRYPGDAGSVTYWLKSNDLNAASVFKVQQSSNGTDWSDVKSFNGNEISGSAVLMTNTLLASSTYVRFYYHDKKGGNVGLDGICVHPAPNASVTFTPSGNQLVPLSNTLTLAVGVPTGYTVTVANVTMTPNPVGESNYDTTGKVFTFTPKGTDERKEFTLQVKATQANKTLTGTVVINVTPYVPPVPKFTFTPASPTVMATKTLSFSCALTPAGSGITGHTVTPTPVGTLSRTGGAFTFATAAADGGKTFTVAVTASNAFGVSTGRVSVVVSDFVSPGTYVMDFNELSKGSYEPSEVTWSNKTWMLDGALVKPDSFDLRNGAKSARMQYGHKNAVENAIYSMTAFSDGIGKVSFYYGPYGSHGIAAPIISVEVAEAANGPWYPIDQVRAGDVSIFTKAIIDVNVAGNVFIRFHTMDSGGGKEKSANIDDITIEPYNSENTRTDFEKFLINYNLTPGDPGCSSDENSSDDFDGDGFSNGEEFRASPQTNPYDRESHP